MSDCAQFQIISDIHIDSLRSSLNDILTPSAPNLIIAGDLGRTEDWYSYREALKLLCRSFKKVILVPGNHEYYCRSSAVGRTMQEIDACLEYLARTEPVLRGKLVVLQNQIVTIDGVDIFGSTFWSHWPNSSRYPFPSLPIYLSSPKQQITQQEYNIELHQRARRCLQQVCDARMPTPKNNPLIVVTHYAPSFQGTLAPHYANAAPDSWTAAKNYMYCSHNDQLLDNSCIYAWVYGHTGYNPNGTSSSGGKLVTNQFDTPGVKKNAVLTVPHHQHHFKVPCQVLMVPCLIRNPCVSIISFLSEKSAYHLRGFHRWIQETKPAFTQAFSLMPLESYHLHIQTYSASTSTSGTSGGGGSGGAGGSDSHTQESAWLDKIILQMETMRKLKDTCFAFAPDPIRATKTRQPEPMISTAPPLSTTLEIPLRISSGTCHQRLETLRQRLVCFGCCIKETFEPKLVLAFLKAPLLIKDKLHIQTLQVEMNQISNHKVFQDELKFDPPQLCYSPDRYTYKTM